MATRRAPSTRTRTATTGSMQPPSSIRPRSNLARSNTSQRSGLTTPVEEPDHAGPSSSHISKPSKSQPPHPHQQEDAETNIQVVIRCRRRSEREIQENSPIIVTTNGPKSQDITIETATPVSSLGIVTLPPTRTYPFDGVFGPEADQALIYHDVVSPMLDEVLMGYNCTLFAYGQTGTGKTYTMQGDLTTTPMGNPSPQAGMIPRVLFRLFHQLETSGADYSVKISFVELYNEELRDLLAPDLAAPAGSTQPMGMGGPKDGAGQLKIFDDSSKKGVFIQGLEESCVKDAADALALLTKGSLRRQIAATKFNDHSSRSHSVFSITVHTKETSSIGDDLLKVGKLNLVDLAGSENIGRSGAENKRAREAGMINQSLLTLGRVINALVDRSSHVPYRESKLTRLLQDSLGGRTKTCIIATISPARSNMEETLSTLDYAIRAKSIRNKPEVNQRMNRNALLKEYVAEIERLKADVLAAREKNGIFFSEETWTQMTAEQELRETEMQEARKQVEVVESQLRNVREEFEQSIGLLMKRDGELRETKEKLNEAEGELVAKSGQLEAAKGALEEEVVVRQAFQESERILDSVASSLKTVTHESVRDLDKLFSKLERKTVVFNSNLKTVSSSSKSFTVDTQALSTELEGFIKVSQLHLNKLRSEAEQYQAKETQSLTNLSARIDEQSEKIRAALQNINTREQASSDAIDAIQSAVQETQDSIKSGFNSWTEELRVHCEAACKEAEASTIASCSAVEKAFKSLGSTVESLLREAQDYVSTERKSLQDAKALAKSTTDAEIGRLQQQNTLLARLLEQEKQNADRSRDELVKRISTLLGDFTAERNRNLKESFSQMTQSNAAAQEEMIQLGQVQGQNLEAVINQGAEWSTTLEKRTAEGRRVRDGGVKTLHSARNTITESISNVQSSVMGSTSTFSVDLQKQVQKYSARSSEGFERASRAKRARIEATEMLATEAQSGYRYMQRNVASSSRNVEGATQRIVSESSSLSSATEAYRVAASTHHANLRDATQSILEGGLNEDAPTGLTPRKRRWEYIDEWSLTESRDVLLKKWRRRGHSSAKSETFLAEHLPLPDGDEDGEYHSPEEEVVADEEPEYVKMDDPENMLPTLSPPSLTTSLSSSSSTSTPSAPPAPEPLRKRKGSDYLKSGLPTLGTLTERSTNIFGGRRRVAR